MKKRGFKYKIITTLLFIALTVQMSSVGFLIPKIAQALPTPKSGLMSPTAAPGTPMVETGSVPEFFDDVWEFIQETFIFGGAMGLRNMANQMAQKFAYDLAVFTASGGKGQDSLIFQLGWQDYMSSVASAGMGELIGTLSEHFEVYGFDLCKPSLDVLLGIQLGLLGEMQPPAPRCDWAEIKANWESFANEFDDEREFLNHFKLQFKPEQNNLGIYMSLNDKLNLKRSTEIFNKSKEREEGKGFKAVTSTIGEYISTPPELIIDMTKKVGLFSIEVPTSNIERANQVVTQIPTQAIQIAVSTFVNTLASRLLQKIFTGLFPLGDLLFGTESDIFGSGAETIGGAEEADERFSFLNQPNLEFTTTTISPISDFSNCPTEYANPDNCVIDNRFQQAIISASNGDPLTVADALEQGLLSSYLPLISQDDFRNTDQYCFTEGYCYSNLVKLRKARILPIGWEIAAKKSPVTDPWTLGEVVDGFYDCQYDDDGNVIFNEEDHPFCHLIDPSWVLKEPLTQCRASTYSQVDLANTGSRIQLCADALTCVAEDEDGNCLGGWSYCTKEKKVWRFRADECPGQYDSCKSLTNTTTKKTYNYLMQTVDFGDCNADNIGCKWYSTEKIVTPVAELEETEEVEAFTEQWNEDQRIYYDRDILDYSCSEEEEGCTGFYATGAGAGTNLIKNNSFEEYFGSIDTGVNADFVGWENDSAVLASSNAIDSFTAMTISSSGQDVDIYQDIEINPEDGVRYFVMSAAVYIPNQSEFPVDGQWSMLFQQSSLPRQLGQSRTFSDALSLSTESSYTWDQTSDTGVWLSQLVRFRVDPFTDQVRVGFTNNGNAGIIDFDMMMLEEVFNPSDGQSAYVNYENNEKLYIKRAPDYYNCYDADLENDAPECGSFVQKCDVKEVGCNLYSPSYQGSVTDDPQISGVVYRKDYCPSECVGYETFSKTETTFEQTEFPLYFIPQTGKECPAQSVGCDQFTNLDVLSAGGEGIEYYNYLRQCIKPDESCGAFYTWEGSDVTGYQLQTYNLQKEVNISAAGGIIDVQPATTSDDSDDCNAEIYELGLNPDCREFYYVDEVSGTTFITYHLFTKTITCSEDCHPFRRTEFDADNCLATNGSIENINGEDTCIYMAIPDQGLTCSAANVGCREYKGNAGSNVRNLINDQFEGDYDGWSCFSGGNLDVGNPVSCELSAEGLFLQDNSLKMYPLSTVNLSVPTYVYYPLANLITSDTNYTLNFWAKADTNGSATAAVLGANINDPEAELVFDLTPNWQQYTLGPIVLDQVTSSNVLTFYSDDIEFFIDKVTLKEAFANVYLIKDSWSTPDSCDLTLEGDFAAQAMLGCQEHIDPENTRHYLKSFSNLCSRESVGCEAIIDTKNSDSGNAESLSLRTQPATSDEYIDACLTINDGLAGVDLSAGWNANQGECQFEDFWLFVSDLYLYNDFLFNEQGNPYYQSGNNIVSIGIAPEVYDALGDGWRIEYIQEDSTLPKQWLCEFNLDGSWDETTNECYLANESFELPEDELMYIVNDEFYYCAEKDAGCTAYGVPNLTSIDIENPLSYQEIAGWGKDYFINDPDNYDQTLCDPKYQGCEEYVNSNGDNWYFRDPGDRICEYREEQTDSGQTVGQWFRKGTDIKCSQQDQNYPREPFEILTKNTDSGYDGWVGQCRPQDDMCTKFIDPLDTSDITEEDLGKNYYMIKNDNLDDTSCQGQVSLQKGCVLFNDTSNTVLNYDSKLSYTQSFNENYNLVSPVLGPDYNSGCDIGNNRILINCEQNGDTCTIIKNNQTTIEIPCENISINRVGDAEEIKEFKCFDNTLPEGADRVLTRGDECLVGKSDTNTIIKVDPDRVCDEWLSCKSKRAVWDEGTSKFKYVCDDIDACNQFDAASSSDSSQCKSWVPQESDPEIVKAENYVLRDVGWNGNDLSGYSIPGMYPLQYLSEVDFAKQNAEVSDFRLARILDFEDQECANKKNGTACSDGAGSCMNGLCVIGVNGKKYSASNPDKGVTPEIECRGYPESNSPFPYEMREMGGDTFLTSYCEPDQNCDCSYQKQTYGDRQKTKYFDLGVSVLDQYPGVCSGGYYADGTPRDGDPCENDSDCLDNRLDFEIVGESNIHPTADNIEDPDSPLYEQGIEITDINDGTCLPVDAEYNRYLGWKGYCIEHDLSENIEYSQDKFLCETWYPVDSISGVDIFNQYTNAGFVAEDRMKYCLVGNLDDRILEYHDTDENGYLSCSDFDCSASHESNFPIGCLGGVNCDPLDISFEHYAPYGNDHYEYDGNAYYFFSPGNKIDQIEKGSGVIQAKLMLNECDDPEIIDENYVDNCTKVFNASTVARDGVPIAQNPIKIWDIKEIQIDFIDAHKNNSNQYEYPNPEDPFVILNPDNNWQFGWCLVDSAKCPFSNNGELTQGKDNRSYYDFSGKSWDQPVTDNIIDLFARGHDCYDAGGKTNYLAMKVEFNDNAEIEAIWWGLCDGSGDTGGAKVEIRIITHDYCKEVVEVAQLDEETGIIESKAFTNRIWEFNNFDQIDGGRVEPVVRWRTLIEGDISIEDNKYYSDVEPWGKIHQSNELGGFNDVEVASDYTMHIPYDNQLGEKDVRSNTYYSGIVDDSDVDEILPEALESIHKLFAEVYDIYRYLKKDGKFQYALRNGNGDDISDTPGVGKPPVVTGVGSDGEPIINTITIGNKTEGDIFSTESYIADIFFYAWANTDQMPLKKISVDYGVGEQVKTSIGQYQNHKQYCSTESDPVQECTGYPGFTCTVNGDCPSGSSCQPLSKICSNTGYQCYTDEDCTVSNGQCLRNDKVCRYNTDQFCEADEECTNTPPSGASDGDACVSVKRCVKDRTRICDDDNECSHEDTCEEFGTCQRDSTQICDLNAKVNECEQPGTCESSGFSFGNSPDACYEGYFHYQTVYTCAGADLDNICQDEIDSNCYNPNFPNPDGDDGACIYVPRVQVIDNWGWCNGDVYGEGGYMWPDGLMKQNECRTQINYTWTYYNGKIIVFP